MRAAVAVLLIVAAGPGPCAAEQALYRPVVPTDAPGYLLHLPAGYDDSEASFPLLFFLHGIVQKGSGSAASLERVADHGPFRTMRDGAWDESLPLIVVGPQSRGLQPWWRGTGVRKVLDHVMRTYRVDPKRRYLTGISMGGRSVWWLAKNFSGEFAALVPVSAWAGDVSGSCEVFRGMGVWAFHGDGDPLIGPARGRRPIEALAACTPPLEPPPRLTLLDATGHGRWDRVYAGTRTEINKGADGKTYTDIYRWLLSFRR